MARINPNQNTIFQKPYRSNFSLKNKSHGYSSSSVSTKNLHFKAQTVKNVYETLSKYSPNPFLPLNQSVEEMIKSINSSDINLSRINRFLGILKSSNTSDLQISEKITRFEGIKKELPQSHEKTSYKYKGNGEFLKSSGEIIKVELYPYTQKNSKCTEKVVYNLDVQGFLFDILYKENGSRLSGALDKNYGTTASTNGVFTFNCFSPPLKYETKAGILVPDENSGCEAERTFKENVRKLYDLFKKEKEINQKILKTINDLQIVSTNSDLKSFIEEISQEIGEPIRTNKNPMSSLF